ncbi:MAG TPA: patatin-like phospholipase family protein [Pyrinomonadaceae bacterium]
MTVTFDSLQQKRIGIALSGGAVRGLAHIGVLKVLQELGIKPAVVAGTSVGSIIGAALSAGMDWRELADMARSVFWPRLLHGRSLERFSLQYLPATIEHLKTPFAAVATIVSSGQPLTITSGALPSAISASCAVRLVRQPVIREGVKLKDGGFACVLPTHACRELGADFVIASDVWEWSSLMRSVGCSPSRTPRVYPSHYRFALSHADIHIHPEVPVSGYVPGPLAVDRMIAVGERATRKAFDSLFKEQAA